MGVTIHFEGKLKQTNSTKKVIDIVKKFAEQNNMAYSEFSEENVLLKRVKDEEDWDYYSSTTGIEIQPHENTDPLRFEFDENGYIQDYCKTQFADIEIHVKIIKLLKQIEPFFDNLIVIDEGEYWDTNDIELLDKLIEDCFVAIENAKQENPKLRGPYRVNTRIIDLME